MLSRRTIRLPATGSFQTAVLTVRPCQLTSFGMPTFTDSKLPAGRSIITTSAPDHRDPLATSPGDHARPRAVWHSRGSLSPENRVKTSRRFIFGNRDILLGDLC